MYSINLIDLSIIGIFLVFCFGIGVYRARGVQTLQQFALGYQNITIVVLATTIFALTKKATYKVAFNHLYSKNDF